MLPWSPNSLMLPAAAFAASAAALTAYSTFAPRGGLFGPVVSRSPRTNTHAVALTFDDGPWPGSTDAILDVLEREKVPATFFVIGRYAARHTALIRRIHAQGHLLGNHTFDHSRTGLFRGRGYWRDQIQRTNDALHGLTGQVPTYFRPPMGFKSPLVMQAAALNDCRVVTWTRRAFDGIRTTPAAIARNLRRAGAGEILLLHDGRDPQSSRRVGATADALPMIIARIRARDLSMVRLDDLLDPPLPPAPLRGVRPNETSPALAGRSTDQ